MNRPEVITVIITALIVSVVIVAAIIGCPACKPKTHVNEEYSRQALEEQVEDNMKEIILLKGQLQACKEFMKESR